MRVTVKGQVTVPQEVREALGITPGSEVDFVRQEDGSYRLVKVDTGAGGLAGSEPPGVLQL